METVLIDTTVASLLHPKKRNSPERLLYQPHLEGKTLALCFQSVAELFAWAEERRWDEARRADLENFLSKFLVIPYDVELARAWARVMTHSKRIGRRLEAGDAWIAATAACRQIPLVTHDRDFVGLRLAGLAVICHAS